ncbi:HAMP domain-containing protein [Roseovarius spongiae]|uniref:histidine kinase n=1 Tax=Roseovarius spongiae TaxID=2320272 RepID=A0A3A8AYG1_9RHOB|nr:ATP-binding protein [Roseovarius spongiae]RKF16916.1 HAMP domain-containing protein [Roseovarius spongiae]
MSFAWLKRYMPRSLYGRTALILLLPVISVLVVVSVVSVQRIFEGVSKQMTTTVVREVRLVTSGDDGADIARALLIEVTPIAPDAIPEEDYRRWYDLSGIAVIREFHRLLPGLRAVVLPGDVWVRLYLDTEDGPVELRFDRRRVSAANPHQLLVNMLIFGGLMTVIAFLYLRGQLRPITRLAKAAAAFGRGQIVPYRPAGATEVRAAGLAFLNMRARIERQIEQRTMMLSGVSHDLRTPLTRLRLGLEMIEDEDRDAMLRDVRDMERLLDAFLAFARDAAEGEAAPVDPVALVRQVAEDAARSNQPVALHEVEGEGEICLREAGIRRAVENLVNNAVRYGSRAELSVHLTARTLRIRVEDDGPGIPPEQREEAVRAFARLEPARNQDKGSGVGLGLSIAADVARAHGGSLRLDRSARLGGLCADIVISR